MSYCGLYYVVCVCLSFVTPLMDWPKWTWVVSLLAAAGFGIGALMRFDEMQTRIDKLERELKQRKDGADE